MKQTVKKVIVGIMAMATFTAFFTGCSGNQPDPDISSSTSTSTSADITPGVPTSDSEFSVQFAYWYDSIKETFDNKFEATEKKLLDSVPIYADATGNEFIVSGREALSLTGGQISPNDLYRNLRKEGTGERYYITLEEPAAEIASKFQAILEENNAKAPETYEERRSSDNRLTLAGTMEYKVFLNNIDTGLTFKLSDNRIEIYPDLFKHQLAWFKGNPTESTAVLRLFTGAGLVNIAISETPEGIYEWSYQEPGSDTFTKKGYVNKNDFAYSEGTFSISLDKIQTLLGYDIDVYDTFINIVTDNKDLVGEDSGIYASIDEINAAINPELNDLKPIEPPISSPTPTPEPSQATSSSTPTPEPSQATSSSTPTTTPTQSTSSSSSPTPTQSTSSSPTPTPTTDTRRWNPDAPGNTPGPYGGYYDVNGALHCRYENMPRDEHGYPITSYYTESGMHVLTYEEDLAYRRETERIDQGGDIDWGLTDEQIRDLWGDLLS